ncbi:relaxase/mobilization nuclease domain-containing protein [Paenibacillus humicola]|uniref:relaxase/mobilization nuclease domain-containing protein n=1 Tax=Paenibacillus humicola TaxID=3110540 RepID=UPI00237AEFF7|nr:relaxase/mobilization nuclease domain-containing protein [Paenibacillus humicola]
MATIKLQTTKVATRLIRYCEKRAVEQDGFNCTPQQAKAQFKATRKLFNKPDGVQAHHVIQSFQPGEVTPQQANEIGKRLVERIAPNHEAVVYTHADKEHIHNHIVINAVSFKDGRKYHSDRKQLYFIREESNRLCREQGLAELKAQPMSKERLTQAEYKAVERGERLWKDELRTSIEAGLKQTSGLLELKDYLKQQYNIEMKIQNKNVSFLHPEKQRYVRGKNLGELYSKEGLEREYGKQAAGRDRADERGPAAGAATRAQGPSNAGTARSNQYGTNRAEQEGRRTNSNHHASGQYHQTGVHGERSTARPGSPGSEHPQRGADQRMARSRSENQSAAQPQALSSDHYLPNQHDHGRPDVSAGHAANPLASLSKIGKQVQWELDNMKSQEQVRRIRQLKQEVTVQQDQEQDRF